MTTVIYPESIKNYKQLLKDVLIYINYENNTDYNVFSIFKEVVGKEDNIKTVKKKLTKYKKKNKKIIKKIIDELIFFHKYKCYYDNDIFIKSSDTHDRTVEIYRLCNINDKVNMTEYYKWKLEA